MDPLSGLWPPLVPWAHELMRHATKCYVTSGYRSVLEQQRLYEKWAQLRAQGYSNEQIAQAHGLFTPARPGCSYHNYGLAFDVGGPPDELAWLGEIWNAWGGLWSARDRVHFQVQGGPICV